jgi:hypothetical protein
LFSFLQAEGENGENEGNEEEKNEEKKKLTFVLVRASAVLEICHDFV